MNNPVVLLLRNVFDPYDLFEKIRDLCYNLWQSPTLTESLSIGRLIVRVIRLQFFRK